MAIQECPECKKPVSDKAPACPHCGCPAAGATLAADVSPAAGASIAADVSPAASPLPVQPEGGVALQPRRFPVRGLIIAALVGVPLIVVAGWLLLKTPAAPPGTSSTSAGVATTAPPDPVSAFPDRAQTPPTNVSTTEPSSAVPTTFLGKTAESAKGASPASSSATTAGSAPRSPFGIVSTTPVSAEEQKYGPGQRVGRYWVRPNVVIDLSNNLMWERGSSPKPAVFSEGVNYCAASQLEGHDNWKVPSIKQLRTLFVGCNNEGYCGSVDWSKGDDCRHCRDNGGPGERGWYMASGVWRNPEYPWFWSATPHPDYKDYRWSVHFVSAYVNYYWPTETYHVRCVRAAQ